MESAREFVDRWIATPPFTGGNSIDQLVAMLVSRDAALLREAAESQPKAIADVIAERARQDAKWGVQRHHPAEWLAILGEEFGEVCKAVCEAHFTGYESTGNWDQYRKELIHTAAVAVAMIECHDDATIGTGKEGV